MSKLSVELQKIEAAINVARAERDRDKIRELNIQHAKISHAIGRGEVEAILKRPARKPRSNKEANS